MSLFKVSLKSFWPLCQKLCLLSKWLWRHSYRCVKNYVTSLRVLDIILSPSSGLTFSFSVSSFHIRVSFSSSLLVHCLRLTICLLFLQSSYPVFACISHVFFLYLSLSSSVRFSWSICLWLFLFSVSVYGLFRRFVSLFTLPILSLGLDSSIFSFQFKKTTTLDYIS